jgi:uncharacterized protein (DUF362 family)
MKCKCWSRRRFLQTAALGTAARALMRAEDTPAVPVAPVSLASCDNYDDGSLYWTMRDMFDQLGGLGGLVRGKTVAMKLNMTGLPESRLNGAPAELAQWVHPRLILALVQLLDEAGATRIRLLESVQDSIMSLPDFMIRAGWDPMQFLSAGRQVEFENTNYLGEGTKYSRFTPSYGGHLFPGYDLNHSYEDCDVFVSVAKLKQHMLAGLTLSMKNVFGALPCTIYGVNAGIDEPNLEPKGIRSAVMHDGARGPSRSSPQELDPASPRHPGYRLPRVVTDLVASRPIHLAIIDGIETMSGSEGPWNRGVARVSPKVLLAGLNPVCTDAVAAAVMGFDPMAPGGTLPWLNCDSILELGELTGIGRRDLSAIEVIGRRIEDVRFPFVKPDPPVPA